MFRSYLLLQLFIVLACCAFARPAVACTGFYIKAKDGGIAYSRSMDFSIKIPSKLTIVPRGTQLKGITPDGENGLEWKTKYGFLGMDAANGPWTIDGFNEKGLAVAFYYFPGFFQLPEYKSADAAQSIAIWQLGSWLLSNFANVEEIKAHIKDINPVPTIHKLLGICPPIHFFAVDTTGKSIMIEYMEDGVHVSDNVAQTCTNSPPFDWHLINLSQYIKLNSKNEDPRKLGQIEITPLGPGTGMLGLPGDATSPSRFVRAAYYVNQLPEMQTTDDALNAGMRLLQYFFLTKGMIIEDIGKTTAPEYSQWQVFYDLKNKQFYYKTYDNINIRKLDVSKIDLTSGPIRHLDINDEQVFQDMTGKLK